MCEVVVFHPAKSSERDSWMLGTGGRPAAPGFAMEVAAASLKIGDRVRIVRKPNDWPMLHRDTKILYNRLIKRQRSLRIAEIRVHPTGLAHPWVCCQFRERGRWRYDHLAILDDGSWIKVKRRIQRT
jgi:hypothetical protein